MNAIPTQFVSKYSSFLVINEKGGVGKTTIAGYLGSLAEMAGGKCRYFEVDDQRRLSVLTGVAAIRIKMPDDESVLNNDQAVIEALDPVFCAVGSPPDGWINIVDIGANTDRQLLLAVQSVDLGQDSVQAKQKLVVIIPTTADAESISSALRSAKRAAIALPSAELAIANMFFAASGVNTDQLSRLNNDYAELVRLARITFNFQALRPKALGTYASSGVSIAEFAQMNAETIQKRTGVSYYAAKSIHTQFMLHLSQVGNEAGRCFRFQRQATEPKN